MTIESEEVNSTDNRRGSIERERAIIIEKVIIEMEDYTIVGNSIAHYITPPVGVKKIALGGATLEELLYRCGIPGIKIVISGVPDIMSRRDDVVDGDKVSKYKQTLRRASNRPGVILCSFYPSARVPAAQYGIIGRLNRLICTLNSNKKEGTPNLCTCLFGRGQDGLFFFQQRTFEGRSPP